MSPKQLLTAISAGKFKPVYYFHGTEDFRMIEAAKYLAGEFLPDRQVQTNFQKVDGRTTKCADLTSVLSVYPMLGERQMFLVNDIQSYKPTEIERIFKLLNPPDPNRIVVFRSPSVRTPKRNSAFFKKIAAVAEPVEFKRLTPGETAGMVTNRLSKAGLTIDTDARQMLVELLSGNLGALDAEINKLVTFKESGETISVEDIQRISAGHQVYSVFELADEIVRGDRQRILSQVKQLVADGNSPTGILFFVGRHFLSLYLLRNNKPLQEGRLQWLAGKLQPQAKKFSVGQLEEAVIAIADADRRCRRGDDGDQVLEELVFRLSGAA